MLHQMPCEQTLSFFTAMAWMVNMNTIDILPFEESLFCHDLHQLQGRGVLRWLFRLKLVVNGSNRCRTSVPEDVQNSKLGVCGSRWIVFSAHDELRGIYYEGLRSVNKIRILVTPFRIFCSNFSSGIPRLIELARGDLDRDWPVEAHVGTEVPHPCRPCRPAQNFVQTWSAYWQNKPSPRSWFNISVAVLPLCLERQRPPSATSGGRAGEAPTFENLLGGCGGGRHYTSPSSGDVRGSTIGNCNGFRGHQTPVGRA
jgi:hypothetical protein